MERRPEACKSRAQRPGHGRSLGTDKGSGFSLVLQMMVGLPGERPGSAFRTAGNLPLSPDGVRVFPTVVIRRTGLEKLWEQGVFSAFA